MGILKIEYPFCFLLSIYNIYKRVNMKKIQKFPNTNSDNVQYSGNTLTTVVDKIITSFDAGEW